MQRPYFQVWDSHVKDKTVTGRSHLLHGNPYTGKITSLYWDGSQVVENILIDVDISVIEWYL